MSELWQLSAHDQVQLVQSREVTATEVAQSHLKRISQVNPQLNAMTLVDEERVLQDAALIDNGQKSGPLAGAVLTTKINTDHAGYPTDNGMKVLADATAVSTVAQIQGLEESGAMMIGRTNSPAFALRVHTGNQLHGETLNPFDASVTPGGSSGGAGVALATGMCSIAQGNDIGGSVRWPAYCTGIVALRPTAGRMPTMPTNSASPRLMGAQLMATQGPMARTIEDLSLAFEAMLRVAPLDARFTPVPWRGLSADVPKRVAVVLNDGHYLSPESTSALTIAAKHLENAGYQIEVCNPPMLEETFSLWGRIGSGEIQMAAPQLLPIVNDPDFTAWMTDWMATMPEATLPALIQTLVERDTILRKWREFQVDYPLLLMPTIAKLSIPARYDAQGPDAVVDLLETLRYQMNLPALGLPVVQSPINVGAPLLSGVQLVGAPYMEEMCLAAARVIEESEGPRVAIDPRW